MAEFWKRVAYRFRSDGPFRFAGCAVSHVRSNPLVLAEPFYQVLKPSWTTLSLGNTECRFTLGPAMISTRDFRGAFDSERQVVADLLKKMTEDDVFWDVGANVGVYTCFASSEISTGGNIVAFEPHPEMRSYLETNVSRNTPDTRVVSYGLGDKDESHELSEVGVAAHTIANTDDHDTVRIDLITAQTAVERHELPRPTVVKIDIEGAELAALHGFGNLINHVRLLYCEVHPKRLDQMGASKEGVEDFLTNAGFGVTHLGTRGDTYFLRCRRPEN